MLDVCFETIDNAGNEDTTNEDDDHHHDRDNKNNDHDDGDACFGGNQFGAIFIH